MDKEELNSMQEDAINEMREMYQKSRVFDDSKIPEHKQTGKQGRGILPFKMDNDILMIVLLLLLLSKEDIDEILIYALIYIII